MASAGRKGWKKSDDSEAETLPATGKKGAMRGRAMPVLVGFLITVPLFVFLAFRGRACASTAWLSATKLTAVSAGSLSTSTTNASRPSATADAGTGDELFGGLLAAAGFDRGACLSRHESPRYYKHSPFAPSSHLLRKLRDYEERHKRCGPGTPLYAKSVAQLRSSRGAAEAMDCNYLVWIPYNGLGNRLLSLVSTFLYALLTDRVLLVHPADDFADLLCEPFPERTWELPPDFPVANLSRLGVQSESSYGNLLRSNKIGSDKEKETALTLPPYIYLHLAHGLSFTDQRFYCDDHQLVLTKVNWLLLQSDLYFVPSLYAIPEFHDQLRRLFPAMESVSHLLGRYLLRPSNSVWGLVTRYYHSYLAQAEQMIGIQIRMFPSMTISADDMYSQILACSAREHILPDTNGDEAAGTETASSKAILVASLYGDYHDRLAARYYEHAAKGGGWVGVFQPSHEGRQTMGKRSHNQKALAEIYLLSFSDELLASGTSTFGYMISSLAGLRPAMLRTANDHKVPETPCARVSMEPCFHRPPNVKCRGNAVDKEDLARHVKACEDLPVGIKLFD